MPREGTETSGGQKLRNKLSEKDLEIRCPERGRKPVILNLNMYSVLLFGNKMPREGTET